MADAGRTRRVLATAFAIAVLTSTAPMPAEATTEGAPGAPAVDPAAMPIPHVDGSTFVPIVPCRAADSRHAATWAPGERRTLRIAGNQLSGQGGAARGCGVPANATAAELSVSVVDPTGGGYLRAWPAGGPAPNASFSNFRSGTSDTNTGSVALGTGGALEVRNHSSTATLDMVIDVQGYYVEPTSPTVNTFHSRTPCRAVDTRRAGGIPAPREIRSVQVAGSGPAFAAQGGTGGGCGVPEGASAVEVAITAVDPRGDGFIRAWPADQHAPDASVVNFAGGQGTTNTASVRLGTTAPDLKLRAFGSATHLVLDVVGYWMPEPLNGAEGGLFHPIFPCRTVDTRRSDPPGALPERVVHHVALVGMDARDGGAAAGCAIPDDALAVETAVTAVAPPGNGFLRAWPRNDRVPDATFLNFRSGVSVTNTGAVPRSVGTAGDLALRAFGSGTHVVLDAFGWYSPPGETVRISPSNSNATRLFPSDDGSALLFDSGLPSGAGLHRWHETDGMSFELGVPTGGIATAGDGSVIALNSRASDMVPPRGASQAIDLWTYEPATGALEQLTHLDGIESVHHVTISGDGRFVGFVTSGDVGSGPSPFGTDDLYLYDRSTSAIAQLTPGAIAATGPASLSRDGAIAAFVATDPLDASQSRTYLWHRSTGAIDILSPRGPTFWGASVSADGSTVAFQLELPGSPSAIAVHDVATGSTDRLTPDGLHAAAAPSLSGDGRFVTYLAYASPAALTDHRAELRLVDRHAGATTTIATGELDQFWPTITTDGRSVFYGQGLITGPDDPVAGASHLLRWQRP